MKTRDHMPQALATRPSGLAAFEFDITQQARALWNPSICAAAPAAAADKAAETSISIYDVIGMDPWTGTGFTPARNAAALRAIGPGKQVTVNINSPGGNVFDGFTIYNQYREYDGEVIVKVQGLAASAASVIAMAGDVIHVARAGFLMIHNTWLVVLGNQNDLREVADMLEPFDEAMAEIYSIRSGVDQKTVAKMMDAETWINGSSAVDQGFADSLLPSDQIKEDKNARAQSPASKLDVALAKAGIPRSERRAMLQEFKSAMPRAGELGTPNATETDPPVTPNAAGAEAQKILEILADFKIPT